MKTLLTFCLVLIGLAGFASTKAAATETTPASLPAVVHMDQVVVVVHHRHHHYYHRRYYYRHHHRYYYN